MQIYELIAIKQKEWRPRGHHSFCVSVRGCGLVALLFFDSRTLEAGVSARVEQTFGMCGRIAAHCALMNQA